jgi:hypothetical protein
VVARDVSAVAELPITRAPSATDVIPVPPPATVRVPERVGVNVKAAPELVMVRPWVWPFAVADEVAKVRAPV